MFLYLLFFSFLFYSVKYNTFHQQTHYFLRQFVPRHFTPCVCRALNVQLPGLHRMDHVIYSHAIAVTSALEFNSETKLRRELGPRGQRASREWFSRDGDEGF